MSTHFRAVLAGSLLAFFVGKGSIAAPVDVDRSQSLESVVVEAAAPSQPAPHPATPDSGNKEPTPEERMNSRFPQPVRVGDLIGLPILDDYDVTIGHVRNVVRTPQGKIQLVVTYGGWPTGWFDWEGRPVPVPIEAVAILGRQIAALDMPPKEFAAAPTWSSADGQPIPPDEKIRIAITRR
jgi:hypothetical protein